MAFFCLFFLLILKDLEPLDLSELGELEKCLQAALGLVSAGRERAVYRLLQRGGGDGGGAGGDSGGIAHGGCAIVVGSDSPTRKHPSRC